MIMQLTRIGSILLAFGLMAASASAQNSSIRAVVKNTDGKPLAGAQVKVERVDAKARAVNTNTDAKGNYAVNGLPVGTFRVSAYGKTNAKEIGGISAKSAGSVTVDLNMSVRSNNKLEKRYVWVKSETGSMIGGRWEEDTRASGPGMNQTENVGREGARKNFEDSHGYNNPGR
jgi:Carboxypeptidase regulatory-like domain